MSDGSYLMLATTGFIAILAVTVERWSDRWYAAAGGGEGAPLADDVLAALDRGADPG